jgi:biotin-dependent carboxylase-like uncharacterized protein
MASEVLRILNRGWGGTLQDQGRHGWRRFGVPPSGVMDDHASALANRLLDNAPGATVVELLLQGARFEVLCDTWVVITGAEVEANLPLWRPVRVEAGDRIELRQNRSGRWTYLAVEGGFGGPEFFGSRSAYVRGEMGVALADGDVLAKQGSKPFELPAGIAGRTIPSLEHRDYHHPPALKVWPAPQTDLFDGKQRERFFETVWTVTPQSDRVGYRLAGAPIEFPPGQLLSEPVRVGTIQVPENGMPIVTMRDGPTVGGYPKLGMLDPSDVSWLAQCRPGQQVRFQPAHETRSEL